MDYNITNFKSPGSSSPIISVTIKNRTTYRRIDDTRVYTADRVEDLENTNNVTLGDWDTKLQERNKHYKFLTFFSNWLIVYHLLVWGIPLVFPKRDESSRINGGKLISVLESKIYSRIVISAFLNFNLGIEANPHSWPWMALIYINHLGGRVECGGSLISNQWICNEIFMLNLFWLLLFINNSYFFMLFK